jgi:hypothetical protein
VVASFSGPLSWFGFSSVPQGTSGDLLPRLCLSESLSGAWEVWPAPQAAGHRGLGWRGVVQVSEDDSGDM